MNLHSTCWFWTSLDPRQTLQTCTFEGPGTSNTTKIPREDTLRDKKSEMVAREGKKREILRPPRFQAAPFRARTPGFFFFFHFVALFFLQKKAK